jgi:hypothetical protein
MKAITKIIVLVIMVCKISFAQIDSLDEALRFYPLHVGDYWQYQVIRQSGFPNIDTSWIANIEVIGDTILANNKKYFVFETSKITFPQPQFIRIDSSNGLVYTMDLYDEIIIDSLLIGAGDTLDCHYISEIYYKNIFDLEVKTKVYEQYCPTMTYATFWELSLNIGIVKYIYEDRFLYLIPDTYELIYAKIDNKEYGVLQSVPITEEIPIKYTLYQNYPNPFNPSTTIEYSIPKLSFVTLKVFDMLGREIKALVEEEKQIGNYKVELDASNLTSGVYYYRFQAGNYSEVKKMILMK